MVEILPEMKHYWAMKHEFCSIDSVAGICQLSTVQLDVEDADRYGIRYRTNDNEIRGCIICHSSIGSIERWMFSILEDALKKKKPELPFWLSPVQVRLIPVSDNYMPKAELFYDILRAGNVRVDIDDADNSVGWKIRQAEKSWIPFSLVIGEKESLNSDFSVRFRNGRLETFDLSAFQDKLRTLGAGFPFIDLFYKYSSSYPIFRGR